MTETKKCPPLGGGSIDLARLLAADAKGKDLTEEVAAQKAATEERRAREAEAKAPKAPEPVKTETPAKAEKPAFD